MEAAVLEREERGKRKAEKTPENTIQIGNMLDDIDPKEKTVILHLCNDVGAFNKGFGYEVGQKYPKVRTAYYNWYKAKKGFELGAVQYVKPEENLYVYNMVTMKGFKTADNPHPIDFEALKKCLKTVRKTKNAKDAVIKIGEIRGISKEDWAQVQKLVNQELKTMNVKFYQKEVSHEEEFKKNMRLIKKIPLVELAELIGKTPVRKGRGKYYSLVENDSCMIDIESNMFFRNSVFERGFGKESGGFGGPIEFVMEFVDEINGDRDEAIKMLLHEIGVNEKFNPEKLSDYVYEIKESGPKGDIELPEKDDHVRNVYAYLAKTREINPDVINFFLDNELLYQDKKKNCIFMTKDEDGKPNFASLRSTGNFKFAIDLPNCDYNECFFIKGQQNDTLIVSEAIIDMMSVMSSIDPQLKDFKDNNYLSINGTNKVIAIFNQLEKHPEINKLLLAFDNDVAGKEACDFVKNKLKEIGWDGDVHPMIPTRAKDWNDQLIYGKAFKIVKNEMVNVNVSETGANLDMELNHQQMICSKEIGLATVETDGKLYLSAKYQNPELIIKNMDKMLHIEDVLEEKRLKDLENEKKKEERRNRLKSRIKEAEATRETRRITRVDSDLER